MGGKGLTLKKDPGKQGLTGGQSLSQLSEKIRELRAQVPVVTHPDSVPTGEPFVSLFPIQQRNLDSITESIKKSGFDHKKALIVGIFIDGKSFLIDGHTRLSAVKALELDKVPIWYQEFENIDEAVDWALHEQIDRRNLSESEIYEYVLRIDEKTGKGKVVDGFKGKSSKRTADIIGTSARKVEQIRAVEKDGSEEQKEAIRKGKKSVNQTYREIKGEEKAQRCANSETSPQTNRDWSIEIRGQVISLIRKNGDEVPLLNFSAMAMLYNGAPETKLRKVVEEYMEKVL